MSFEQTLNDLITLTGFTADDIHTLQEVADHLKGWGDEITAIFYDTLYGYQPTQAVFREGERPAREGTLRNWYQIVVSGDINDKFWRWQWYVGLIHIPRGISNPFMLGMMSRVQQFFGRKCQATFDPNQAAKVFGAFKRVTDVIAGLIAEGYFQSYVQAMERMSGQSRSLIDRMVQLEVQEMVSEKK
jgi:Protoglobin